MKAGWSIRPLGELCKTGAGGTPLKSRKEFYEGGNIPWLLSGEVSQGEITEATNFITQKGLQNSSARLFPPNTVLVAMYGATAGQVGILRFEASTNQAVCGILPSVHFLPEFLFYFFLHKKDELVAQAAGNAQPNISQIKIRNMGVPAAPLPEQHRIVALLDEAFDGIAVAHTNAEKNLQNARALFESHLQSVFTERGEGWVEQRIGEICTLKSGTSVSVSLEKAEGEIPYVKLSDMTYAGNETEIVGSSRYLDMAEVGKNSVFPEGTTIFPKRGGAILTNKKRLTALPICADLNIMGVIPPSNLLPRLLYYYFLNVDMRLLGSGSSIPQINNYDIAPLKISFPEAKEEQGAILQMLDDLSVETQRLESITQQKLTALDDLKKSLLHQAFSGQL
ncbi:MAG: restriction endonuclease subunit S [Fimbriimonadaceae bacterium]|nr:restriction endonuclease subunit S [Fimbriimonadaceae bacterium]